LNGFEWLLTGCRPCAAVTE